MYIFNATKVCNTRKANNPIKKWEEDQNRNFTKKKKKKKDRTDGQ